jgi:hypothetical protein
MMKRVTKTRRCAHCRKSFKRVPAGRPRVYCDSACRQAAYLARKLNRVHPVALLAADLAHVRVKEWLRKEIWNILMDAKLVSDPEPPAMAMPSHRAQLRLVKPPEEPSS